MLHKSKNKVLQRVVLIDKRTFVFPSLLTWKLCQAHPVKHAFSTADFPLFLFIFLLFPLHFCLVQGLQNETET